MHHDHILLRARKQRVVHAIRVLDREPLCLAGEAFLLNAGDIKHVRLGKDLLERLALEDGDARLARGRDNAGGHGERGRRDEVEADAVEREERDEAVDRAPVLEVAEHGDGAAVDCSELGTNGVNVQEGLAKRS